MANPVLDEPTIESRARALGDALVAGNIDAAIGQLSDELRRNLGEVLSLLPIPLTAVAIESIERESAAFVVVMCLTGDATEDRVQTRWKDRDGTPKVVEVSHLSRTVLEAEAAEAEAAEAEAAEDATESGT
jgi:hypothetical protein